MLEEIKYAGENTIRAVIEETKNEINKRIYTPVSTEGTGAAYTVTVDGITALAAGVSFTMIPHTTSTSKTATLNVNGLGAKMFRRPVSSNNTSTVANTTDNWLYANKPVEVMYNGTYWIVTSMPRPNGPDIYGTVPVSAGGVPSATTTEEGMILSVVNGDPAWIENETVLYSAQSLTLDQQAQARENIGAADMDSLIEVFGDIDDLKANAGGNVVVGVIDSHYYNFRLLNEERGATMAEIREAAQSKDKDIVIRLDLDNWQGTLQYLGLVDMTDDGSTYQQVLLFSTIKMNNGVVNTNDNVVSGTVQLEYWYTTLESGDSMPPNAFMNCQFAEINLAPGTKNTGSFMRVNEKGLWDVEKVDIVQSPATASVGQVIVVKTVDANGKPTEWDVMDMPQGSNGIGIKSITIEEVT